VANEFAAVLGCRKKTGGLAQRRPLDQSVKKTRPQVNAETIRRKRGPRGHRREDGETRHRGAPGRLPAPFRAEPGLGDHPLEIPARKAMASDEKHHQRIAPPRPPPIWNRWRRMIHQASPKTAGIRSSIRCPKHQDGWKSHAETPAGRSARFTSPWPLQREQERLSRL